MDNVILGIDIGGSGIKGAPVDVRTGELLAERHRIPTPQPATPEAVALTVKALVDHFHWTGPIGCTFPAIVKRDMTLTAANVDQGWINTDAQSLFSHITGLPVLVINDADAAGLAELHFGAARNQEGVILMLTFGTGIGSALIVDGALVPNSELGHLEYKGMKAEHYCSDRVRELEALSWKAWGKRVDKYLNHLELLFSPDLFIIGGGVSKKHDKFFPVLDLHTRIVPATLRNEAGIIGVAGEAARVFADTNWQLAEEARLHTLQHTPPTAPVSQTEPESEPEFEAQSEPTPSE